MPVVQVANVFATPRPGQRLLQAPQCDALLSMLISHPSAALALQSLKPGLHAAIVQTRDKHEGVALGVLHTRPHDPQLLRSVAIATSQPSDALVLQSACVDMHEKRHVLSEHVAMPFGGVGQTFPQRPQWLALEDTTTSQPLLESPSQSALPATHPSEHVPIEHTPTLPPALGQTVPHAPQFRPLVRRSTSHPSSGLPLQSAKLGLHAPMRQTPASQAAVALGKLHTRPHPLQ